MTDKVKDVARALFEADYPKDNWERFLKHPDDVVRLRYTALARAAITELRTPTPAMSHAASPTLRERVEDALGLEVDPTEHRSAFFLTGQGDVAVTFQTFACGGPKEQGERAALVATSEAAAEEALIRYLVAYKEKLPAPKTLHWRSPPVVNSYDVKDERGTSTYYSAYCRLAIT